MIIYNRDGISQGNTVDIDATLSISGAVAEAKSTGDRIAEVSQSDIDTWFERVPYGLINQTNLTVGSLNESTGTVGGASGVTSDFIEVTEGMRYILRKALHTCAYDGNKDFVTYVGRYAYTWVCPTGVKYVRISSTDADKDVARIVEYDVFGQPDIDGYIYKGATNNADVVIRKSIADFAPDNPLYFTESDNLFDYEKDWVQFSQGAKGVNASTGEFVFNEPVDMVNVFDSTKGVSPIKFFPVAEGQTFTANHPWMHGAYYDANKEYLGALPVRNSSTPSWVAPTGCAYVRVNFYNMASEEILKGLTVKTINFEVNSERAEKIDFPVPSYQINGSQISPNYLDKVVPNMVESRFLSAMKCLAIREANGREHSFRIGNFNMYVGNYTKGWDLTKKMMMDYGCDFCGFEEVNTSNVDLASFLKSWQFPYGFYTNASDGLPVVDKSFVSRFPVVSSSKPYYVYSDANLYYLNCKVQLPRLLDVYGPFRVLSVYVVHLSITTASDKEAIANQILATIAQDTSDYVVIFGDMNDMGETEETKTYWRAFETAGFRPVLPITSKTITDDDLAVVSGDENQNWKKMALDQFCVSSNIEIKRYGIVNTKDGYGDASIQSINGDPCLSDHDFVWCDLVFKDEART